jgi:Family of unknown function (DUF6029)
VKQKALTFSLIIFFNHLSFSQDVVPSVSNLFRYGNGERNLATLKIPQTYFENLTDARISIPENFVIGFRLLIDDPPEIGETFKGISRRYIEYNKDNIYMRAGNSSTLFGRGLALNLFENRGLAYDTWMDGIKFKYTTDFYNATILGGTINFRDSINFVRNEIYKIRGGNFEINPFPEILIGGSYIYSEGVIPQGEINSGVPSKNIKAEIPEAYLSLNMNNISLYIDWSHKWTNVITDHYASNGSELYGALSYFSDGYGLTLDYKNYSFDILDPYGRNDATRPTRMLPFQNPPIVQKEYSFTLLTRPLHEVDFNDEVGFQVDAFYSVSDNTTINFNSSLSSRHDSYNLNPDGFTFTQIKRSANFLPSTKKELFPYYEIFIEGEHYYTSSSLFKLAFALRQETFFNEFSSDKSSTITTSIVAPIQIQNTFSPGFSLTLQSEHEWVRETFNEIKNNYFNQLITLISSFYSRITATIRYEYTTSNSEVSERKNWLIGELGYRLEGSHTITISYGSERGGQVCSNGICKYIQPFEGLRISILSQL